jgi:predicted transcriptional regulator
MPQKPPLGEQELETLNFVAENAPISVGDVAKHFSLQKGLARTTVLTVMERLRTKGYLVRKLHEGLYVYEPKQDHDELLADLVANFVERSLGGSLSPVVAYLADSGRLTQDQLADLQRLIDGLSPEKAAKEESR